MMIHITKIYLVTNCFGDPNKVYIGKTINCRKKDHKLTYGNQIEYTYIDEIQSLNRKDWETLETYWIHQFRAWGFQIMNKRKKGGGGLEFCSEEIKNKMRKARLGKKFDEQWIHNMKTARWNNNRKRVFSEEHKQNMIKARWGEEYKPKPKLKKKEQNIPRKQHKNKGIPRSEEIKNKIKEAKKNNPYIYSEEIKSKMRKPKKRN